MDPTHVNAPLGDSAHASRLILKASEVRAKIFLYEYEFLNCNPSCFKFHIIML